MKPELIKYDPIGRDIIFYFSQEACFVYAETPVGKCRDQQELNLVYISTIIAFLLQNMHHFPFPSRFFWVFVEEGIGWLIFLWKVPLVCGSSYSVF